MIQLTITGNTLEEVFENVAKAHAAAARLTATPVETNNAALKTADAGSGLGLKDDLDNAPVVPDEAPKRGRGRPPKTIDATVKDVTPPSAPEAASAKTYTVDDIRARVQKITDNAKERGDDMPAAVAYVKKLFARFGMAKVSDLPAGKYGEFMVASEKFLEAGAK